MLIPFERVNSDVFGIKWAGEIVGDYTHTICITLKEL